MPSFREFIFGPWRAVAVLGVTQILAWGAVFYPPVMTVPLIAADRGFSFTFAMGGFSAGLLAAGFVSPTVGGLIDRYGGHRVMPFGSLAGAAGLVALTYASHPVAYFAVWMLLGAAMAASLYDPAFATLGRIFGAQARQPITVLTLAGGFASTVSWPATYALLQPLGWQRHVSGLCGTAGIRRGAAACLRVAAHARHAGHRPRRRRGAAAAGTAGNRRRLSARRRGVRRLCVRAVRALGASARDLSARRARAAHRRADRHAVRPLAGRRAAVRVHLRAQCPSADDGALCGRHARAARSRCCGCSGFPRRPRCFSP